MYYYTAYGLNIKSEIPFPELGPGKQPIDVIIRSDIIGPPPQEEGPILCLRSNKNETCLAWGNVGTILVCNGNEMVVDACSEGVAETLRVFILGAGLSVLLFQRGFTVLHGSAIAINRQAIVFLGERGTGKSTTAAAFCARGYQLIADDVVLVKYDEDGKPVVPYGYPQLKLWPDVLDWLGWNPDDLPRVHPKIDKRSTLFEKTDTDYLYPLLRIYILGDGDKTEIISIPPQMMFVELMRNLYITRFVEIILLPDVSSELFQQCVRLVKSITIRLIQRKKELLALLEIVDRIKANL